MLSSEKTREEILGNGTLDNSGNGYPVGFKVLADTDLKVYVDGTLRTLTNPAEYTVANAGTNTNATVSFLGSAFGTPATQLSSSVSIVFVRDAAFTQPSNYQNNDIFDAETLENSLDRATMLAQQSKGGIDRAIKFSDTATGIDTDVTTITAAATLRANKLISFDANGDIQVTQEIGTFKGDWAGQTVYVQRDLVKQNSNSDASTKDNIYICTKEHTSTGNYLTENDLTSTVTDKWTLVLDVASASGGLVEAVAWSTKTDGQVVGSTTTDYSSKAYAIGGTGIDTGAGSAKDWASKASGNVGNTSLKSARQYVDDIASSASTASTQAGQASDNREDAGKYAVHPHNQTFTLSSTNGGTSGLKSALHYATEASNSATTSTSNASRFLTAASSDPATRDPNGSGAALQEGDLYFNTTDNKMKVRNASNQWQDTSSSISSVASVEEFTASNGQGTDSKYFAVVHDVGLEIVWLNGVRLKRGSDYICTNTNSDTTARSAGNSANFVKLETVPGSSDILSIMAFGQIDNNLAVNKAGGTFTGGVTFEAGTTHNLTSNNTSFTLPTTRGTDGYVLTRDDSVGTGGTAWKETITAPSITNISGEINEDTNTTLTVTGSGFASGMTIKLINASSGADITGHTTLSYTGSSSPLTVTIPSATTNITAGTSVKLHINKQGLTTTSGQSIVVSEDPNWVSPADNSTIATILSNTGTGVNVGSPLSANAGANGGTINYVIDSSDTSATTYFDLGLTSGQITTDASNALSGLIGSANTATETFIAYAQIAGEEATKKTPRTFNIIVNKPPIGGTIIEPANYNGSYRSHKFLNAGNGSSTNNFVLYAPTVCDILMVAGGGGGGYDQEGDAGGGGAGGMRVITSTTLSAGTYTISVGAGGDGGSSPTLGGNTTMTGQTASAGGGYGGTQSSSPGANGGSGGGGGGENNTSGGTGAGSLGTNGNNAGYYGGDGGTGNNVAGTSRGGAGGGGASQDGGNADSTNGGHGGEGLQNNFETGNAQWYAAGGSGGHKNTSNTAGPVINGISGRGGDQNSSSGSGAPTAGVDGTGAGGGGGYGATAGQNSGGDGVVIIRYAT